MNNEANDLGVKLKSGFREWTAVGMLLSGNALAWTDYFLPTPGNISDDVLWFFSQCLIYAGSMLGISIYVNSKVKDVVKKLMAEKKS